MSDFFFHHMNSYASLCKDEWVWCFFLRHCVNKIPPSLHDGKCIWPLHIRLYRFWWPLTNVKSQKVVRKVKLQIKFVCLFVFLGVNPYPIKFKLLIFFFKPCDCVLKGDNWSVSTFLQHLKKKRKNHLRLRSFKLCTMHYDHLHWTLHLHTSFSDLNKILRPRCRRKVETDTTKVAFCCEVSFSWDWTLYTSYMQTWLWTNCLA